MKKLAMITMILALSGQVLANQPEEDSTSTIDAQRRGGANVVAGMFKSAGNVILQALRSYSSSDGINSENRKILDQNLGRLIGEFSSSRVEVDNESTEVFKHHGLDGTWIETDARPLGKIRIRTQVMKEMIGALDLQQAMYYLAHEIGHHLYISKDPADQKDDENKAWNFAGAIVELANRKVSVPALLNVSHEPYEGSSKGCRDQVQFKVDALAGIMTARISSSECVIPDAGAWWLPWVHDLTQMNKSLAELSITYVCRLENKRTICEPKNRPEIEEMGQAEILADGTIFVSYWYQLAYRNMGETMFHQSRKIIQEYRVR